MACPAFNKDTQFYADGACTAECQAQSQFYRESEKICTSACPACELYRLDRGEFLGKCPHGRFHGQGSFECEAPGEGSFKTRKISVLGNEYAYALRRARSYSGSTGR